MKNIAIKTNEIFDRFISKKIKVTLKWFGIVYLALFLLFLVSGVVDIYGCLFIPALLIFVPSFFAGMFYGLFRFGLIATEGHAKAFGRGLRSGINEADFQSEKERRESANKTRQEAGQNAILMVLFNIEDQSEINVLIYRGVHK